MTDWSDSDAGYRLRYGWFFNFALLNFMLHHSLWNCFFNLQIWSWCFSLSLSRPLPLCQAGESVRRMLARRSESEDLFIWPTWTISGSNSRILVICCLHCTACITRNVFLVLTALCVGIIETNGADPHRSLLLHFWLFPLIVILRGHFIFRGIYRILYILHYVRLTQLKCLIRKDIYSYTDVF